MASAASWTDLHRIEPFGHSWLPKSFRSTYSRTKALILIWAVLGVLPAVVISFAALLDGSFYLEGEARGLLEGWFTLAWLLTAPTLASSMAIVYPKLPEVLISLQQVLAQAPSAGSAIPETKQPSANYTLNRPGKSGGSKP